jgi:hypothetical protein
MTTLFLPVQLGTYANDGSGDDLRTAFTRVNNSFAALLGAAPIDNAVNLGPSPTNTSNVGQIFADKNNLKLEFKALTSTSNSVVKSNYSSTVNLEAITTLVNDTTPILGGNLNLNGHTVSNGNIQANVQGYDISILASQVALMFSAFTKSNSVGLNIDFGSVTSPAAPSISMGNISPASNTNQLDFGTIA